MKKKKSLIGLLLLGTLALVALAAFIYLPLARQKWTAPLGPQLGLPTYTPTVKSQVLASPVKQIDSTPIQTEVQKDIFASQPRVTETAEPAPTATPQPLCGGPEQMVLLAVGADSDSEYLYGLSDVIRIVRVDFVTPKVSVLSMPRDLWVEIPDISEPYGITHGKLNQAYFYGSPGMGYYKGPGASPGLLARTLDLNFGIRPDHYGAVDMSTFVKIVDAVGGIDLYLPTDVDGRPIDDKTEDMGYFTAGQHHFNGEEALRFSRIRKKYNDFTRMDHQNMVICALKDKITGPSVFPKIPKMIAAFQDSVLTDLSLEQLTQLACLAPSLKKENLLFTSLPAEIMTPGRVYSPQQKNEVFIMEADFAVIREYVSKFLAGSWPSEPDEPTCPK